MKALLTAGIALLLSGCVSTMMRQSIGDSIQEVEIRYGSPVNVIAMPDGSRAYQYPYGGGQVLIPSSTRTTAVVTGPVVTAQTTGSPGGVLNTSGCILTFIARPHGSTWVVEEIRVPKGLLC